MHLSGGGGVGGGVFESGLFVLKKLSVSVPLGMTYLKLSVFDKGGDLAVPGAEHAAVVDVGCTTKEGRRGVSKYSPYNTRPPISIAIVRIQAG